MALGLCIQAAVSAPWAPSPLKTKTQASEADCASTFSQSSCSPAQQEKLNPKPKTTQNPSGLGFLGFWQCGPRFRYLFAGPLAVASNSFQRPKLLNCPFLPPACCNTSAIAGTWKATDMLLGRGNVDS